MAPFAHKLFYLRTQELNISQMALATALGIRQATISFLEQGISFPTGAMVVELAKYFDVTPTYLLDDERGVIPAAIDRWSVRHALVTVGMWIEAPETSLVRLPSGKVLCPLLPGEAFFDEEAKRVREQTRAAKSAERVVRNQKAERSREELELGRRIRSALRAQVKRKAP